MLAIGAQQLVETDVSALGISGWPPCDHGFEAAVFVFCVSGLTLDVRRRPMMTGIGTRCSAASG